MNAMQTEHERTLITTFHPDANNIYVVLDTREINPDLTIISNASEVANVSKLKLAGKDLAIVPEGT